MPFWFWADSLSAVQLWVVWRLDAIKKQTVGGSRSKSKRPLFIKQMGQAESKTIAKRGLLTTTQLAQDVGESQPRVDHRPQEETALYFTAKLVVGDEEVPWPIASYSDDGDDGVGGCSEAYFCVEPGQRFMIRCELARPPPEGIAFGARVYVDAGATNVNYDIVGSQDDDEAIVDTVEPDHFFWFGPGETSYTIRGFFADNETSVPFIFGTSRTGDESDDDENVLDAQSCGCVRVQFAKVEQWVPREKQKMEPTKKRRRMAKDDMKGANLCTVPAAEALKDPEPAPKMEAVLSPKILYESRIFYNDFSGYRSQASVGAAMLDPTAFQGLPIPVFHQTDVRRLCVDFFLRTCQRARLANDEHHRITDNKPRASMTQNPPVPIADVVNLISDTLSNAASFLVCVGHPKPGNYGETSVQRFHDPPRNDDDRDTKVSSLTTFFSARPDLYALHRIDPPPPPTKKTSDEKQQGRRRWLRPFGSRYNIQPSESSHDDSPPLFQVAFAEINLLDDD